MLYPKDVSKMTNLKKNPTFCNIPSGTQKEPFLPQMLRVSQFHEVFLHRWPAAICVYVSPTVCESSVECFYFSPPYFRFPTQQSRFMTLL